jgi:methionyl-tRNA formyltransferase
VAVISAAIEKLKNTGQTMLLVQDDTQASNAPLPGVNDLQINWSSQSAKDVENLVNACNPDFGGAVTSFRNQVMRFLEVAPAEINNPAPSAPGTIVYADGNYGIFVACSDNKFLRVNIIQSSEGILSGFKLASLGVTAGERFV